MNGNNFINSAGVFGTQGVFAASNTPPALYEACEWTDHQGNFWLLGGLKGGEYAALWEFKPGINQWAWIKGPTTINQAGIYGTFQVPSINNYPGGRAWGVATWVDTAGDLWLFGGLGHDVNNGLNRLNDLWRYHIPTNEWTWMGGPNTAGDNGNYGTFQVPNALNNPPARYETNAAWTDNNSNLWLFGGYEGGYLSDMWEFNTSINQWAWMKGPNVTNQPAVYGLEGVANPANVPNGRMCYAKWKESNGNFWLFGGWDGSDNWNPKAMNDVWRFNPNTFDWTWMKGPNMGNDSGIAGVQCLGEVTSEPRARMENRACWTQRCDNFVNFGGSSDAGTNRYNDLWNYSVGANIWTRMNGSVASNQAGSYGTITVSSTTNIPPSRFGCIGWSDSLGNMWMFGGSKDFSIGEYVNDMWRFVPDSTCPNTVGADTVTSAFTAQPLSGCSPLTVTFNNTSINGTFYTWSFGDTTFSTVSNPTHTYNYGGTYTVLLIANASCSPYPDTSTITITVLPGAMPIITGDSSLCFGSFSVLDAGAFSSYNWSNGSTTQTITVNTANTYSVTVTNANGCTGTATKSVTVHPLPTPTITGGDSLCSGSSLILDAGSYSQFNWSNGITTQTNTITTSGNYIVTVTDINGCTATASQIITVNPSPLPTITASGPLTFCQGDSVVFNVGAFASYNWSNSSTTPSITITASGTYIVTVTNSFGCTGTASQSVTVIPIPLVSSAFIADTLHGCNPLTVHFTNNSSNGVTFFWNFGDGFTDTTINPTHTYTDTGIFTVTLLTINDTSFCGRFTDSSMHIDYIAVTNPVIITSNFSSNPITGCTPLIIDLTNNSSNATTYYWNFGNGQTSTDQNPPQTFYIYSGTYTITLITSNLNAK